MKAKKTPAKKKSGARKLPRFSDRYELGGAKLKVSPFCLGMVGEPDTVLAAYDAGINFFFFTADMHWPYYEATRQGLTRLLARGSGIREKIVVGIVSYCTQPEFCYAPFSEAMAAVPGLERVDVPIAGGAYANEFLVRAGIYQQHRRSNFLGTRAIGTTFHDRKAALSAIDHEMIDIAFIRYNPSHPGAREDLFPLLDPKSATLLYNFKNTMGALPPEALPKLGLDDSYWKPKVTDYYRFVLTRPEIDGSLIGLTTPDQVTALAKAMEEGPLDEEEEKFLMDLALLAQGRATLEEEKD